ncbi:MAG: SUF system NifU family Fe-S cluster assembly protein [Armatimonadetes bacterium]|nr:SUF system NifU family Fe-S cluster assembly protein [Armatimonadota bacterium]
MPDELFQDVILRHYRQPSGRGRLREPTHTASQFNPLCGDEITIDLRLMDGSIEDIRFESEGCSICQASASIMVERVKGQTVEVAEGLIALTKKLVIGDAEAEGDLSALGALRKHPGRQKCGLMAWEALEAALQGAPNVEAP